MAFDSHTSVWRPLRSRLLKTERPTFIGFPPAYIAGNSGLGILDVALLRICHIKVSPSQTISSSRAVPCLSGPIVGVSKNAVNQNIWSRRDTDTLIFANVPVGIYMFLV